MALAEMKRAGVQLLAAKLAEMKRAGVMAA
jgi:hypothetical protein